jgi:hypothetical protein
MHRDGAFLHTSGQIADDKAKAGVVHFFRINKTACDSETSFGFLSRQQTWKVATEKKP